MFWRKKGPDSLEPPKDEEPPRSSTAVELDAALEGAAHMLRARARHAFHVGQRDASTIAANFERWAAHVLVRSPPPSGPGSGQSAGMHTRDWRGLVHFVTDHARREQEWVHGSMREMREAVFALVDSLGSSAAVHGRHDVVLRRQLASLENAASSGSVEALKREALAAAAALSAVIAEQQELARRHAEALEERLHVLTEQLEQTRREGETDPLTRLSNRRAFDVTLRRALSVATLVGRPLALLMVDIDHFKRVNDMHGHPVGDKVLCAVADALARTFPRGSDLVARYGGEEIAVVLSDSDLREARVAAERCTAAVRALRVELASASAVVSVTCSVGVAVAQRGEDAASLVARADRALYEAKRTGRDRFVASTGTASPQTSGVRLRTKNLA